MTKDFLGKVKTSLAAAKPRARMLLMAAGMSCTAAMLSFASDASGGGGAGSVDVGAALTTSLGETADTIIQTVFAVLPVVLSVFSAYLCINYGLKFFKKFIQ